MSSKKNALGYAGLDLVTQRKAEVRIFFSKSSPSYMTESVAMEGKEP